jgi:hypothetical protein
MMIFYKIIDKSFRTIVYLAIFFSITTILEFYNIFKDSSFDYIDIILDALSYNQYESIAIWFNVLVWIVCGFSFILLRNTRSNDFTLTKKSKNVLLIIGSLICLMSLEKIFHIHLLFEFRAINLLGFFSADMRKDSPYYWVFLIVIPIFLFIFLSLFFTLYKLYKGIEVKSKSKKTAILYILTALLCIPLNVVFDIFQGYLWYAGKKNTIFNSIEAIIEVVGLICFIGFNSTIAAYYTLRNVKIRNI